MPLSNTAILALKPKAKAYKAYDQDGLFLTINPSGSKLWRFKYAFQGKEKLLSLGAYPYVSLKDARTKRDETKKLLSNGIDPSAEKKRQILVAKISASNTFSIVAQEFIAKMEGEGLSETTLVKQRWFLSHLEGDLGQRPISEIEPVEILACLKKIEKAGKLVTAKRVCAFVARIYRYAIITSRARYNVAADLSEALIAPKVKHHAAIVEPKAVGHLLRAIDGYEGHISTALGLKLLPHVFVRPGELRHAEWSEIDLAASVWRIPAKKMKMKREHVIPLSRQSVVLFEDAQRYAGNSKFVFPSLITPLRPMSENTLNVALRRLGYTKEEMTSHGFRSTASTLLNESGKWSSDAIERALAHKDADSVRSAYHRGAHWEERVQMAQWWSDYLDELRDGSRITGKILAFNARG